MESSRFYRWAVPSNMVTVWLFRKERQRMKNPWWYGALESGCIYGLYKLTVVNDTWIHYIIFATIGMVFCSLMEWRMDKR